MKVGNGKLERDAKKLACSTMKTVKRNFNVAIAMRGIKLSEACEMAGADISQVSRVLSSKNATLATLHKLAIVAGTTLSRLITEDADEKD